MVLFNSLPDDLLNELVCFLVAVDISRMAMVASESKQIFDKEEIWKELCKRHAFIQISNSINVFYKVDLSVVMPSKQIYLSHLCAECSTDAFVTQRFSKIATTNKVQQLWMS